MKIIFLDIDGVLNSDRSFAAFGGFPWPADGWEKFDPVAIGLLKSIVDKTGAKVVLSSSWRMSISSDKYLLSKLSERFDVDIIDHTPFFVGSESRGDQIQEWLDSHNNVTSYVIIDDDADMLEIQKDNFVRTTFSDGLSYHNYLDCLRILGSID